MVSKLLHQYGVECSELRKEDNGRSTPMQRDMLFPLSEDTLDESGVEKEARISDVPAKSS